MPPGIWLRGTLIGLRFSDLRICDAKVLRHPSGSCKRFDNPDAERAICYQACVEQGGHMQDATWHLAT